MAWKRMNGADERNKQKGSKTSVHAVVRGVDVLQREKCKQKKGGYIIEQVEEGEDSHGLKLICLTGGEELPLPSNHLPYQPGRGREFSQPDDEQTSG